MYSFEEVIGPTPVVVVVSKNRDGSYHQAPFSWIVPLSKRGSFGILMRRGSKTLENCFGDEGWRRGEQSIIGVNRMCIADAQNVRMMKGPDEPFLFDHDVSNPYYLVDAAASLQALAEHALNVPVQLPERSHIMTVFKIVEGAVFKEWEPYMVFTKRCDFYSTKLKRVPGF